MISVICVYNDKATLEKYLLKGLEQQKEKGEIILIDNTSSSFSSAAKALNFGGSKATSKYLMFIHQDVLLQSPDWLSRAECFLDALPNLGIAGVAGMTEEGWHEEEMGRNVITHGEPPTAWSWGKPISNPVEVQIIDECLILIPNDVFQTCQFDEVICNGWDLYAADYCLSIKRTGLNAYVIPMPVHHGSRGHVTEKYFETLSRVLKKHKGYYKRVNTTVGSWSISYPLYLQRKWIRPARKKLQRAVKKAAGINKTRSSTFK